MKKDNILILKNDRAGDLFTSLTLISTLLSKYNNISIYMSQLNIDFSFFFKNSKINRVNYNLTLFEKTKIFIDILINKYDRVYILTPKKFYFYLPFIFRKIKFYAITYDNNKNLRPSKYLRSFLYKHRTIYRNKINLKSYRDLQSELLENDIIIDKNLKYLNIPKISKEFKSLLPDEFIVFQFRYLFFHKLGWGIDEFKYLLSQLKTKYKFILFSSDIENNRRTNYYNKYFSENYSILNTINLTVSINKKILTFSF